MALMRHGRLAHHRSAAAAAELDFLSSELAKGLRAGGVVGGFLDGPTNVDVRGAGLHLDTSRLPDGTLKELAGFVVFDHVRQHVLSLPRGASKVMLLDELRRILLIPGATEFVKELLAQMRSTAACSSAPSRSPPRSTTSTRRSPTCFSGQCKQHFLMRQNNADQVRRIARVIGLPGSAQRAIAPHPHARPLGLEWKRRCRAVPSAGRRYFSVGCSDEGAVRRREFIVGVTAAAWPLAARAQGADVNRRVAILNGVPMNSLGAHYNDVVEQQFRALGWIVGGNLKIEPRFGDGDYTHLTAIAAEIVATAPDAILANGVAPLTAVRGKTATIPVVFVRVSDPVGQGFVANLARPGGNMTGFTNYEISMVGKWLQTLKEIAPQIKRVAVMAGPISAFPAYFQTVAAIAPTLAVQAIAAPVNNLAEIDRAIAGLGGDGGLIVLPDAINDAQRDQIVALTARYRVPAIYPYGDFATLGGLISYGIALDSVYRAAATYIGRILKGEKPGDLPVQAPTKFELVVNLKTAKALGLVAPQSLLATADQVIE